MCFGGGGSSAPEPVSEPVKEQQKAQIEEESKRKIEGRQEEKEETKGEATHHAKGAGGDDKPRLLKAITDDSFVQNQDKLLECKKIIYKKI